MGKNDIDHLQSFGAKIKKDQHNVKSLKNKTHGKPRISVTALASIIKKYANIILKKIDHRFKKIGLRIKAIFSPYMIKLQTRNIFEGSLKATKANQRYLHEKRKRIGNTIIIIRSWKKVPLKQIHHPSLDIQHLYYFHQRNKKKNNFDPRPSIWDMPSEYEK